MTLFCYSIESLFVSASTDCASQGGETKTSPPRSPRGSTTSPRTSVSSHLMESAQWQQIAAVTSGAMPTRGPYSNVEQVRAQAIANATVSPNKRPATIQRTSGPPQSSAGTSPPAGKLGSPPVGRQSSLSDSHKTITSLLTKPNRK